MGAADHIARGGVEGRRRILCMNEGKAAERTSGQVSAVRNTVIGGLSSRQEDPVPFRTLPEGWQARSFLSGEGTV